MADQDFGLFAVESAQIAPLVGKLDGYPTEDHQLSLQTTEHPVESGGSVTDNAVKLPDKLRLEGWVSDGLPAGRHGRRHDTGPASSGDLADDRHADGAT